MLTRGADVRRIPYWLHVERPKLGKPTRTLTKAGNYSGDARKGRAAVSYYRYPEGVNPTPLNGPEQVFGLRIARPVSNFGVRVVSQGKGVRVTPRVVRDNDENRLTGYVGPARRPQPVPRADLASGSRRRRDPAERRNLQPRLRHAEPRRGRQVHVPRLDQRHGAAAREGEGLSRAASLTLAVTDAGSGVDPTALRGWVDGTSRTVRFAKNRRRR